MISLDCIGVDLRGWGRPFRRASDTDIFMFQRAANPAGPNNLAIPTSFIVKGRRYTYAGVPRVSLQPGAKDLKAHAVGVISHCRGPVTKHTFDTDFVVQRVENGEVITVGVCRIRH